MPYLTVYTNAEMSNGAALAEKAAELTAKVLHKPVSYVVTNFIYNQAMAFGGKSQNKGALVELKSIGLGDKDKFVSEITSLLSSELNIPDTSNIAVALTDSPAAYTACAGRTFG